MRKRSHDAPAHPAKAKPVKVGGFTIAAAAGALAFIGGLVALEPPVDAERKVDDTTVNASLTTLDQRTDDVFDRYDDCVVSGAAIC
ncbi:MAG: hypothetical protein RIF41_40080 [Polyangiaceae bacterium]